MVGHSGHLGAHGAVRVAAAVGIAKAQGQVTLTVAQRHGVVRGRAGGPLPIGSDRLDYIGTLVSARRRTKHR